jgi:hypothetical protein
MRCIEGRRPSEEFDDLKETWTILRVNNEVSILGKRMKFEKVIRVEMFEESK